ncbi:MAG: hypothetical protein V3U71_07490 [Cocleimonas sp.]
MVFKTHSTNLYLKALLSLCLVIFCFPSFSMVWKSENTWDAVWEKRYQHWVKNNWTEEFFMNEKKPIYYKFSHDCADAVYAMRLIFAYEYKLPFVIHNPSRRGKMISNGKTRWDKYPQEKRVRKFMDYIADMTSTRTLARDTFPVALDDIKPGDIYAAPNVHAYQVVNITETGVAEVMSSTTPKAPRFLDRIPSFPFYVPEDTKRKTDGYRRFIQPQNIRVSLKKQPGYNDEQFKIAAAVDHDYVRFTDIIASALGTKKEEADAKTLRLLISMCMYANDRAVFVYDALYKLQEMKKKGRKCMTRTEYNNYSTPSRDRRLKAFFNAVKSHYENNKKYKHWTQPQRWAKTLFSTTNPRPAEIAELNKFCQVQMSLGEEYYIPLRELRRNLSSGKVISDPHAPLEYRWGAQLSPYKPKCKTY